MAVRNSATRREAANRVLPSRGDPEGAPPPGPTAGAIHCCILTSDLADGRGREPSDSHRSALSARSNRGDPEGTPPPGSFSQSRVDV
jgi:hypothetical protein